jgi:[acyl-carrier-protein] S-malonyltransferase
MVAGHFFGKFSALVANGALSFEDGLKLVPKSIGNAKACEIKPSTAAAVFGIGWQHRERVLVTNLW